MRDYFQSLALRGAGLASADGYELLAPRVPARFEPMPDVAPLVEAGPDPGLMDEAAWRDSESRAASAPRAQESGLNPPTGRANQSREKYHQDSISRDRHGDVVSAQPDAPQRPVQSGDGNDAFRPAPVREVPGAVESRNAPARRILPGEPGPSPSEGVRIAPARGDRAITAAAARNPEIVRERGPVVAHAATPRALVLPTVPQAIEPAGRGDALPAMIRQAPSNARPRDAVAPVNVTIGRIEIQVAAPAAPAPASEPIPRTRGFDAYTHARRGHRR